MKQNSRAQVTLSVRDIVDGLLSEGALVERGTVAGVRLQPEDMAITPANPTGEILAGRTIPYASDDEP